MKNELKELLPFLHDRNPQVRQIALSNLLGNTAKGSPNRDIFLAGIGGGGLRRNSENECIRDLKLLCRDQLATAHDAFRALVNLSDNSLLAPSLSETTFLTFLVSYILNPSSILADLASMLLSNITASSSVCAALISLRVPVIPVPSGTPPYYAPQSRSETSLSTSPPPCGEAKEITALPLLLYAFVQAVSGDGNPERQLWKGHLHFLSVVFANVAMASTGRLFFLTPSPADIVATGLDSKLEYPLAQLVVFTEHTDTIRRGGVASTIKHCAFHVPAHKAILFPETESVTVPPSNVSAPAINALPYILLPLAGPEEFDLEDQEKLHPSLQLLPDTKKREPDEVLRLTHVESLILLCTTRGGRDYLRKNGAYEIIRTLHASEQSETVREHIEKLVNLLKGEEKPVKEIHSDIWSHRTLGVDDGDEKQENSSIVFDTEEKKISGNAIEDADSDDERIVEV